MVAFLGDLDRAEDATQEAFAIAARRWPIDGPPERPRAWLVTTARNRAIDRARRDRSLASKTRQMEAEEVVRRQGRDGAGQRATLSAAIPPAIWNSPPTTSSGVPLDRSLVASSA